MGVSERRKGLSWEREVAKTLRELDPSARRVLEYQEGLGYDIYLKSLPFFVQCKSQKRPNLVAALNEAVGAVECDAQAHSSPLQARKFPLAVCKVTGKGEYAIMRWQDFFELLKKAYIRI